MGTKTSQGFVGVMTGPNGHAVACRYALVSARRGKQSGNQKRMIHVRTGWVGLARRWFFPFCSTCSLYIQRIRSIQAGFHWVQIQSYCKHDAQVRERVCVYVCLCCLLINPRFFSAPGPIQTSSVSHTRGFWKVKRRVKSEVYYLW